MNVVQMIQHCMSRFLTVSDSKVSVVFVAKVHGVVQRFIFYERTSLLHPLLAAYVNGRSTGR